MTEAATAKTSLAADEKWTQDMSVRTRKLIGATLLLIFIPLYAQLTVMVAVARLPGASILVQTLFFGVAGLLWVVPAGLIIRWMQRPQRED